jgi:hypothetical protein
MKFDAARWPVPPGVEIHFYFQCMREPQFYKTRTILDKLILDVGMFPDRVAMPGDMIPSHFVWAHAAQQPPSGVFRRSTGNLAMDLGDTDSTRPVALSHIVKTLAAARSRSTTSIHWIVRDEEGPADLSGLTCQYPDRTRIAAGDEESNLVPLTDNVALAFERNRPPPVVLGPMSDWPGVGIKRRANSR